MKTELLLSILLLSGAANVCAAQETAPDVAPPVAPAPPPTPPAPAVDLLPPAANPSPPAEAGSLSADGVSEQPAPTGPVIAYSGSMTQTMIAMSAAKAALGMIGGIAMAAEGKQIVADNNVVDPSHEIAKAVATDLAQAKSGQVSGAPVSFERKGAPMRNAAALAALAPDVSYIVDVDSMWIMNYFAVDWIKYKVILQSRMRVIDTASQKVVVKHFCDWDGEKHGDPKFTRDELLADGAKGLKEALGRAAIGCVGEFKTKVAASLGTSRPAIEATAP